MEKKITKRDDFMSIIDILTEAGRDDLVARMTREVEILDHKSAKAKEAAARKKATTDELADVVAQVLTDELTTIADITAQIDGEDVTVAKVTSRLTRLVSLGIARKEQITVGEGKGKRKCMAYAKAVTEDVEAAD